MSIKAALLDAPASSGKGKFVRIETLKDASELTDRHVSAITECDLPEGRYVWVPGKQTFVDERALTILNEPTLDGAVAGLARAVQASGTVLPPETTAWLDKRGDE
jgi:hypothetical protein